VIFAGFSVQKTRQNMNLPHAMPIVSRAMAIVCGKMQIARVKSEL
jgi:hypothetical protein